MGENGCMEANTASTSADQQHQLPLSSTAASSASNVEEIVEKKISTLEGKRRASRAHRILNCTDLRASNELSCDFLIEVN